MAKNMTATSLKKLEQKLNQTENVVITDKYGDEHNIALSKDFRDSKVSKVALRYLKALQTLNKKTEIEDEDVVDTSQLLPVLIFQEFTNIPIPKELNVDQLIKLNYAFIDSYITAALFNEMGQENIDKISDFAKRASEGANGIGQNFGELALKAK
ncbi:hypothetical protein [Paenibacillus sp. Marseille-Q4541]|uniref:hypothetical protein n=1 Tax=Paenibacillus sp. Marseille-Q4541 TaxID=2831522 RepID=UPI001BA81078|nr:hypothetical protein [Paenibacillus sp. Marseille-Q4541]